MAASSASRTRSFGGCGKCRARHMKCDEQRPKCSNCIEYNLQCDGYTRNVFFDSNESEDGIVRYRQVLFTDTEREQMNKLMTSQVPLAKTNETLNAIETACETDLATCDIQRGPFGAFRLDQSLRGTPSPSLSALLRLTPTPLLNFDDSNIFQLPEWIETSSLFDFEACASSPMPVSPIHQQSPATSDTFEQWLISTNVEVPLAVNLHQAPLLLKHYAENVVASLTPFRHAKTPWHVLFLPNAKTTLAGLAMGEIVNSADLTIFYGILAVSALDLDSSSTGSRWHVEASNFQRKAQVYFQDCLQHVFDQPKAFKYKSTVMAILISIQLSMINGPWEQTDTCFLEAERVIRLRGLTKKQKSRKVRLLHHCYAYIRVFHESLSSLPAKCPSRLMIRDAIEKSGVSRFSQDPLSFRLTPWVDLEKELAQAKNREQGENDLHLSIPGLWTATLYPEIFGVPEMWLMLLSQVIRLANEKEIGDTSHAADNLSLREYMNRAKDLETCILRWEASATAPILSTTSIGEQIMEDDRTILESLLSALKYALGIYFYRRILDVDPEILQQKVIKVRECLFACKQLCQSSRRYLNSLIWPAFIAGCEATDTSLQESFSAWFKTCTESNRHASLIRMRSLMQQVWHERSNNTSASWISWVGLLKTSDQGH